MIKRAIMWVVLAAGVAGLALVVWNKIHAAPSEKPVRGERGPVPVEAAPVEVETIVLRRTFSGSLESPAAFRISAKVGGRVVKLQVDLADPVQRGQVVAELDNDETLQLVKQKEAELAVARAEQAEADSALSIALRERARTQTLADRGVASPAQSDEAEANWVAREAATQVAAAQVKRAEAELASAHTRLDYTRVTATWNAGSEQRYIAERLVREGDTVTPNDPLFSVVELDTMLAVFAVSEQDYAGLRPGLPVTVTTDAFPVRSFSGSVARVAPVFAETSRQARVEVLLKNPERLLKPGMFVRVEAILSEVPNATVLPVDALTRREGSDAVFVIDPTGKTVALRPVSIGIRDGKRVQVTGEGIAGRVVVLGQQLLSDGSHIVVPDDALPQVTP